MQHFFCTWLNYKLSSCFHLFGCVMSYCSMFFNMLWHFVQYMYLVVGSFWRFMNLIGLYVFAGCLCVWLFYDLFIHVVTSEHISFFNLWRSFFKFVLLLFVFYKLLCLCVWAGGVVPSCNIKKNNNNFFVAFGSVHSLKWVMEKKKKQFNHFDSVLQLIYWCFSLCHHSF